MKKEKEVRREATKEEALKALDILESMVLGDHQTNDYFNSGDKDSRFLAFESVMIEHNITPSSVYKLDSELVDKYSELYKDEIENRYNEIVKGGKELESFYNTSLEYLKSKREFITAGYRTGSVGEVKEYEEVILKCDTCGKDIVIELFEGDSVDVSKPNICNKCANVERNKIQGFDWGL